MRIHNGEKPFDCKLCGKFFTEKSSVKRHLRKMHFNQYNKKCTVCGIISKTREEHRDHLVTHKLKVYTCQVCQKDFIDSRALKVHTFNAHSAITQSMNLREYRCQECDKQFFSTKGLKNHLKTHKIDFRMYSCSVCNKLFLTEQGLSSHMRTHATNKEHVCELCNKHFNSGAYAAFHRKQHILEKLNDVLGKDTPGKKKESIVKVENNVEIQNVGMETNQIAESDIKIEHMEIDMKEAKESDEMKTKDSTEVPSDSVATNAIGDLDTIQGAFKDYVIQMHPFKNFSCYYFFKASETNGAEEPEGEVKDTKESKEMLTDTRNNAWFQMSDSDKKARGFAMYRCSLCKLFKLRKREILRHHETVHAKRDSYSCDACTAM